MSEKVESRDCPKIYDTAMQEETASGYRHTGSKKKQ